MVLQVSGLLLFSQWMALCGVIFFRVSLGKKVMWSQSKSMRYPSALNHDFEVMICVSLYFFFIVSVSEFALCKVRTTNRVD